jgi:hypothetical protein
MPFDGAPPFPKPTPAAEILLYAEVKFLSGAWVWIQGDWGEKRQVCLVTAIRQAAAQKGFAKNERTEALRLVARIISPKPFKRIREQVNAISMWNDTRGRKFEEIVHVLRQAQELAYGGVDDELQRESQQLVLSL